MNPYDHEWSPWTLRNGGLEINGVPNWARHWKESERRIICVPIDWLDPEVPVEWLALFLRLIRDTPNLRWLLRTKRPELWMDRMHEAGRICTEEGHVGAGEAGDMIEGWIHDQPPANVWIGTEIRTQAEADERIPHLLRIPAAGRFLIVRPNGQMDLQMMRSGGELGEGEPWLDCLRGRVFDSHGDGTNTESIGWLIISGDDGPNAQPTNVEHVRSLVRQCQTAGVACWVEQLGSKLIVEKWPRAERDFCNFGRVVDLKLAHPKGGDPAEWPADLRVQKLPEGLR